MKLISIFSIIAILIMKIEGQELGSPLAMWEKGFLDIHHINTGKGDAAFFIFPDGTTMLIDAGDHTRPLGPRELNIIPNEDRFPGEWIARYIAHMSPQKHTRLNYVLLTHFHNDHMGGVHQNPRRSLNGDYYLSGITEVAEFLPFDKMIDRGWPEYNWPIINENEDVVNYRKFLLWQKKENNLVVEKFKVGRNDQIVLVHDPTSYSNFEIRNMAGNGIIWTGLKNNVRNYFPPIESLDKKDYPTENMCSLAIRLSYGDFNYYTGGDLPGYPSPGLPEWMDVESPLGQVVGPVDVHVVNHHGFLDAANENFLKALKPKIHVIQSWTVSQPSPSTLARMLSRRLYTNTSDVFATNITETNRVFIGSAADRIKGNGHILIRVLPGGGSYSIYILEDREENYLVKEKYGPYFSK